VAGLSRDGTRWIVDGTGEPLVRDKTYRVLVNSFMYAGGSGYGALAREDPDAFDTGIHYRQPFQDWLEQLGTSRRDPLRL
jgi:2',3'-cyclic-nucleotide 2'-phosphodiesterase (5'-nucleotidase family)